MTNYNIIPCVQTFENVNWQMTGAKHQRKALLDFQADVAGFAVCLSG